MDEKMWQPLRYKEGDTADYDALHEGIPEWMAPSFSEWLTYALRDPTYGEGYLDLPLLRSAERRLRMKIAEDTDRLRDVVWRIMNERSDEEALALADFLLSCKREPKSLNEILHESGSVWKVGVRMAGRLGLLRRVPEGAQRNADHVMANSGRAGSRLEEAWGKAFGINPDPSGGYASAVKAVEDASIPVVVPNQAEPSLGHVIGQLRRDGDWSLPLTREDPAAPTSQTVLRMCQALWKGHHDRHGGGSHPLPQVSQEEAETAVTLAVPLVQWFASGMVARR